MAPLGKTIATLSDPFIILTSPNIVRIFAYVMSNLRNTLRHKGLYVSLQYQANTHPYFSSQFSSLHIDNNKKIKGIIIDN